MKDTLTSLRPSFDRRLEYRGSQFLVASSPSKPTGFFQAYRDAKSRGAVPTTADIETALSVLGSEVGSVVSDNVWTSSPVIYHNIKGLWHVGVSHEIGSARSLYEHVDALTKEQQLDALENLHKIGRRWRFNPRHGIGKLVLESVYDANGGFTILPSDYPYSVSARSFGSDPIVQRIRGPFAAEFGAGLAANDIDCQNHYFLTTKQLEKEPGDELIVRPLLLGSYSDSEVIANTLIYGAGSRPVIRQ